MRTKILTLDEITAIYREHMPEAFPKDEIRPLSNLKSLYERGKYMGIGGYDENGLKVYGLYVTSGGTCMLDYLAVLSGARGGGIGSQFLKAAAEHLRSFNLVLLEVERIESAANEAETATRTRRIDFYRRNGCRISGVKSTVYGVDYNILYLANERIKDDVIINELENLYHEIFTPEIYRVKVFVYR